MDLYQIFIEHNRPWSGFEIICYFVMLILLFFVYIFLYKHGKVNKIQIMVGLLLFTYYCIVLESTVFTRKAQGYHDYELEVFWSWKAIIQYHSNDNAYQLFYHHNHRFHTGIIRSNCQKFWCKKAGKYPAAVIRICCGTWYYFSDYRSLRFCTILSIHGASAYSI